MPNAKPAQEKLFRWFLAPGYRLSQCLNDVRDHGVYGIHGTPIKSKGKGLRSALITMTVEYGSLGAPRLPSNRDLMLRLLAEMKHKQECQDDPKYTKAVCDGIYGDRVDSNLGLVEALRAVYALAGQDKQVRKIIEDAIEEHGI